MPDLRVTGLYKSYGEKTVLSGLTFTLPAGGRLALMGRSGCGKTTLLRILLGLETADGGRIEGLPPRLSVVFQEDRLCPDFSAFDNVRLAAPAAAREEIFACLASLGLGEADGARPVRDLSGGMRRRVAIARAWLAPGELLLLDEPFKGLDDATRAAVTAYLDRTVGGRTLLLVTHDVSDAAALHAPVLSLDP